VTLVSLILVASCVPGVTSNSYPNERFLAETGWLSEHRSAPQLRIVDVRGGNSYAEGHIPGAVYLNMGNMVDEAAPVRGTTAPQAKLEAELGSLGITPDTTVVAYDDSGGLWATRLFWILDYLQHKDVRVLNGGWSKWVAENRPQSQEVTRADAAQYKGNPLPERFVGRDQLLARLSSPDIRLVDARTPGEYTGQDIASNKRGGHIPGAINIEWGQNLTQQRTWKSAEDLKKLYEAAGVTRDKEVITYCQTGVRGAHDYFTLRLLGYPKVGLYSGSWEEWGNDPTLPLEK